MFDELIEKIRYFDYRRLFSGWRNNIRFFWFTHEKGPLIFFSIFGFMIASLSLLIYTYLVGKDDQQNLKCLALNIYFEARGEPRAGQHAVAEVTMNRVASSRFPDTICEVVYQQNWDRLRGRYVGAFSWTELELKARLKKESREHAWGAAETIYYNRQAPKLNGALFYHANYVKPSWARRKKSVAKIGKHIFYK